jgi:hypothetical protein
VDARVLLRAERFDGAVHAAGFAAECALKARLERAIPGIDLKRGGHDLGALEGRDSAWAAAASGDRDLLRITSAVSRTLLTDGHPERRYWETTWTSEQATAVVHQATDVVDHRVVRPWLDRGQPLDLG